MGKGVGREMLVMQLPDAIFGVYRHPSSEIAYQVFLCLLPCLPSTGVGSRAAQRYFRFRTAQHALLVEDLFVHVGREGGLECISNMFRAFATNRGKAEQQVHHLCSPPTHQGYTPHLHRSLWHAY